MDSFNEFLENEDFEVNLNKNNHNNKYLEK